MICLLLIVLWARSYWRVDQFVVGEMSPQLNLGITSMPGALLIRTGIVSSRTELNQPSEEWLETLNRASGSLYPSRVWGHFAYSSRHAIVPYWFLVGLTAILGAITSFQWRFSLRTLLIATTLLAVLLGAIIYALR
jgi:hypothetical protein